MYFYILSESRADYISIEGIDAWWDANEERFDGIIGWMELFYNENVSLYHNYYYLFEIGS